ncbi:MAG TPA: hypothetical protein PLY00_14860, partial [Verrucomicrobiota bacterium]|nr:hypothetical protein [Verrucomicrobiota bacterium]HQK00567.1 hypothetical protein [Verrucomicrobiota bacterium]
QVSSASHATDSTENVEEAKRIEALVSDTITGWTRQASRRRLVMCARRHPWLLQAYNRFCLFQP